MRPENAIESLTRLFQARYGLVLGVARRYLSWKSPANKNTSGPRGDYAAVCAIEVEAYWADIAYLGAGGGGHPTQNQHLGPFRLPSLVFSSGNGSSDNDGRKIQSWSVRYTFALWEDGTSNQLIFGEKNIPGWAFSTTETAVTQNASFWDCAINTTHTSDEISGVARVVTKDAGKPHISRYPGEVTYDARPTANWFGSFHPGICQFLIGDGSVRAIPVTTPLPTTYALGCVNDGTAVSLP